jgi:hypothetical protein
MAGLVISMVESTRLMIIDKRRSLVNIGFGCFMIDYNCSFIIF